MILDKMKKIILLALIVSLGAVLAAGCAKKTGPDDKVLAEVSNKFITLKDFKYRISRLPAYYQNIVEKNKKRFLDETIAEMLFYEEAVRKGLDRDREVVEVISEAKKKILIAKLIKNEVEDKVKIEDDEIKEFYEAHKDDFKTQELWRASHILLPTEEGAKGALADLSRGASSFEELAKERSMDATASRGGDVGYFRKGQLVPDFEKACLELKVGETGDIIHTQFGWHIIKLTDKKEPAIEPYEKAKRAIEGELKKRKRSELFDKLVLNLKEKYRVKIEDDVFRTLEALKEEEKAEK